MPLSLPALIVIRSPGANERWTNDSWLPVTRIGVGGTSKVSFGAQASDSTSAGSLTGSGAGARCAKTGNTPTTTAAAARDAATFAWTVIGLTDKLLISQRLKPDLGVFDMLARRKFLEQPLEVRDGFWCLIGSGQRLRQIEVDRGPAGVFRVVAEHFAEAIDRAGIPADAVVVQPDTVRRLAEAIPRDAPVLLHFGHQRAVREALEEDVEFLERLARFGLIALGRPHLLEMTHRQLVLGVVGAHAGGIELQELPELVRREDDRRGGVFAQVGITNAELGVRTERALRVAVDDLLEIGARVHPLALFEGRGAALEQKAVGLRGSGGRSGLPGRAAGH